jgi:predicted peroxiredoxin
MAISRPVKKSSTPFMGRRLPDMAKTLVVKVTRAQDEPERAHIAVNVAATALASGLDVHLFLAAEGVELARPGMAFDLADAPPVGDLLDAVYAGGTVTVCTPCATRRGYGEADFREGTRLAGSAAFVALLAEPDATALVY